MTSADASRPKADAIYLWPAITPAEFYNGVVKKITFTKTIRKSAEVSEEAQGELILKLPAGTKRGTRVVYRGIGNEAPDSDPGDVFVTLQEESDPQFTCDGTDLICVASIPLVEALTGSIVEIKTLDGRLLRVPVNEVINPDSVKTVAGEGMPLSGNPEQRGNLFIHFKILFPESLSPAQRQQIKAALSNK